MVASSILVVDDNLGHLEWLQRTLKPLNCPVVLAPNAVQAVQRLYEATPALVLLDIGLPGISGEEVLYALKTDPRFAQTTVVLMAAPPLQASNRALALADEVLPKPIDVAALDTVVKSALGAAVCG